MELITNAIPSAVFFIMWVVGLELNRRTSGGSGSVPASP